MFRKATNTFHSHFFKQQSWPTASQLSNIPGPPDPPCLNILLSETIQSVSDLALVKQSRQWVILSLDLLERGFFFLCPVVIVNELSIGFLFVQMAFKLIVRNLSPFRQLFEIYLFHGQLYFFLA